MWISRPRLPGRFSFPLSALSIVAAFGLMTRSAPAEATRPILRPATAIRIGKMSLPIDMELGLSNASLGLDQEDKELKGHVLTQAAEYIEFRRGKMRPAQMTKWIATCEAEAKKVADNPFCRYERNRKSAASARTRGSSLRVQDRKAIAAAIVEGNFEKIAQRPAAEITASVSWIENHGQLIDAATKVSKNKACVPSTVSSALAYKLEERFPEPEIVALATQLYRKASSCGNDYSAAHASFRLGLLQVWEKKCEEIPDLMRKVEATPEASTFHARAKYWRFYCANAAGDETTKAAVREELLKNHPMSFQTLAICGLDETAMARILQRTEPKIALRSLVRSDMNSFLRAIEALVSFGADDIAAELIDRTVRDIGTMEPEVRLYVATVLTRIGQTLPKFKILSDLFQDQPSIVNESTLKLFFPLRFYEVVRQKQEKVDPLLILSLIRQESAFNTDARSIAGARGLMQVMPGTARMVASVRAKSLHDPLVNIGVGTKYFLKRLEQYDGDVELTLAAYNAGFGRVEQWRKRYPTDNKMLFLDFIPFRETRDYVSSILRNYYWYVKLYSPNPEPVETRKVNTGAKTLAIVNANAGAAAAEPIEPGK